ncbi:hypothetical protein Tco_0097835 [Tanacetum coccineum]
MDDPNITMEEYIKLEEEKARKRGKVFNWETNKYGNIWYDEDLISVEKPKLPSQLSSMTDMALPPRDQRHQYLRFEGLQYTEVNIADYESRLAKICRREVHRVQVFDFGGLSDLITEGLSSRMLIEHRDAQGQSMFTSRA